MASTPGEGMMTEDHDDVPLLMCPVAKRFCDDEICQDYGCALKAGCKPDWAYEEDNS